MTELPEHVLVNREYWDTLAASYVAAGERSWRADVVQWGVFNVPQSEAPLFLDDVDGTDAIELRLLRPGGRLAFLCNSVVSVLCAPDDEDEHPTDRLLRPQRGLHKTAWPEGSVDFHLGHGDMIRLLRDSGFEVEDLIELYAPEGAADSSYAYAPAEWSRQWPVEEIWKARRR